MKKSRRLKETGYGDNQKIIQTISSVGKCNKMRVIKVKLPDTVEADVILQKVEIGADGDVSVTCQKVLVDTTTTESVNDGDPFQVSLTDDQKAAIGSAVEAAIAPILGGQ